MAGRVAGRGLACWWRRRGRFFVVDRRHSIGFDTPLLRDQII